VHSAFVPQVFQDDARPLDVRQAAALLGWTSDAVRVACERGELAHARNHLNAYRISCLAVAALIAARPFTNEELVGEALAPFHGQVVIATRRSATLFRRWTWTKRAPRRRRPSIRR